MTTHSQFQLPRRWTRQCKRLLTSFNHYDVRYVLIGSMARLLHDPREPQPEDIDLMIDCSKETSNQVLKILPRVFPGGDYERFRTKLTEQRRYMPLPSHQKKQVDLLTPTPELDFSDILARATHKVIRASPRYEIKVRVASAEDLTRLDEIGGRSGDGS